MKVTLNHPQAKDGFPVILNGKGEVMREDEGIKAILARLGITHSEFAARCGILPTTLHRYGRGARTPGNVLNLLGELLKTKGGAINNGPAPDLTALEKKILSLKAEGKSFGEIAKLTGLSNRQRAHQIFLAATGKQMIGRARREPVAA